jgi:hypothetical protein
VNEYVPLLAVLVFTAGQFGFWSWFVLRLSKETRARELDYLKIVRDLQNRLTAKDINGYVALRSQDEAPTRRWRRSRPNEWAGNGISTELQGDGDLRSQLG